MRRAAAVYLRIACRTLSISCHYLRTIERSHLSALGLWPIGNSRSQRTPTKTRHRPANGPAIVTAAAEIGQPDLQLHFGQVPLPQEGPMQVKLCAQCPYSPRDLEDHYEISAALHLCAMCDVKYDQRKTLRRRTCRTRMMAATGKAGLIELHAARFATESSASFATIVAALPSVRSGASSASSSAGRATAAGYGGFELRKHGSKDQNASSWRLAFSDKEPAS